MGTDFGRTGHTLGRVGVARQISPPRTQDERTAMTNYVYLVSYSFQSSAGAAGNGRVFITRDQPIAYAEDIEAIEALQNERNNFRCGIMNFQLLRTYND